MPEFAGGERHWTEGYFDEWCLRLVGDVVTEERTRWEVDGLRQLLPPPPARVLDVRCGQGRRVVGLARFGDEVVGLDASPYLERARAAVAATGVAAELVASDMRALPFEGELDAVVNMFTTWGYYDDERTGRRSTGWPAPCAGAVGR